MIQARWEGIVSFETFSDLDRGMVGETEWEETVLKDKIEQGKYNIKTWMEYYNKHRWENQPNYIEGL